jgi:hypothetical protein
MRATLDVDPFALEVCVLPPERADELRLRDEAELPLREEAAAERRLDALALLGLLREAAGLRFEELRLLVLDPSELRAACFRLPEERVLAWAIAPP